MPWGDAGPLCPPKAFNTDQGAQFTSTEFIATLKAHEVRMSMEGRGRWRDNVFVERPRHRSNTKKSICAYDTVSEARSGLARYIQFFNTRRPHTALDRRTPEAVYFDTMPLAAAA